MNEAVFDGRARTRLTPFAIKAVADIGVLSFGVLS